MPALQEIFGYFFNWKSLILNITQNQLQQLYEIDDYLWLEETITAVSALMRYKVES
ncbi:hypothetical protein BMF77_03025 [Dolichospermum sp. UHCC 0315A]|nr:hypothetical protein BMF77_03025 [Dolichospermum sp. UHCC 0315A]